MKIGRAYCRWVKFVGASGDEHRAVQERAGAALRVLRASDGGRITAAI